MQLLNVCILCKMHDQLGWNCAYLQKVAPQPEARGYSATCFRAFGKTGMPLKIVWKPKWLNWKRKILLAASLVTR